MNNKKILLVDGSNLVFRGYFALQRSGLMSKTGKPSGAIFSFMRMLCDAIIKEKPTAVLVAMDPSVTFRHEKYAYYKANRPTETPPDLIEQFPEVERIMTYLGIPCFKVKGIEADDIIGSVSYQASQKGIESLVFSGDKDNFQLVHDNVKILYPDIKGGYKTLDEAGVKEKLGVLPKEVVDYKALSGDASDNIKGVPGVGPKTAITLLEKYGTVDDMYEHLEEILPLGVREKMRAGKESCYESQWLATIKLDAKIPFEYENFELKLDADKVLEFLDEYDMNTVRKLLPEVIEILKPGEKVDLEKKDGLFDVDKPIATNSKYLITETKNLFDVPIRGDVGVSFDVEKGEIAWIIDSKNISFGCYTGEKQEILRLLEKQNRVYYWDLKTELYKNGYEKTNSYDNLVGLFLENNLQKLDITGKCEEIIGEKFEDKPALQQLVIGNYLTQKLEAKPRKLWEEIESPLTKVLATMENQGVHIDLQKLQKLSKTLNDKIETLTKTIKTKLGDEEININSSQQLGEKLTQKGFKLPLTGKTKNFSTDREALEKLLDDDTDGLIADILEYRTVSKLSSSFVEAFLEKLDANNRLHTTYSQVIAATGRLSSNNPNLQNIPVRSVEYGALIRSCFSAPTGRVIIAADYSQMELRLLAHFCEDEGLQKAFLNGEDIHARTAAEMFEKPIKDVTKEERGIGKTLNFALVYQQGAFSTAKQLGISQAEAKKFIELYFARFPKVKPYVEQTLENARTLCYTETIFGRRRYFKYLNSNVFMLRSLDERAAFNAGLQGSGADMIKKAMIGIQNEIDEKGLKSLMVLQVHDELVFEVPKGEVETMKEIIGRNMRLDDLLSVPVVVDIGVGDNWAEAK
jgi:DNA polymerase I